MKVTVIQTDNRLKLDYLSLTKKVNEMHAKMLDYNYKFLFLEEHYYKNANPATGKIKILNDYINESTDDIIVFLDSDAWIQQPFYLDQCVQHVYKNDRVHGCYSRDPLEVVDGFINSGSFILKINEYVKNMYSNLVTEVDSKERLAKKYNNKWPYDQYYVGKYVLENKDDFLIFYTNVINSPLGIILRHNWWKDARMYHDLNKIITNKHTYERDNLDIDKLLDDNVFPNIIPQGQGDRYLYKPWKPHHKLI